MFLGPEVPDLQCLLTVQIDAGKPFSQLTCVLSDLNSPGWKGCPFEEVMCLRSDTHLAIQADCLELEALKHGALRDFESGELY